MANVAYKFWYPPLAKIKSILSDLFDSRKNSTLGAIILILSV